MNKTIGRESLNSNNLLENIYTEKLRDYQEMIKVERIFIFLRCLVLRVVICIILASREAHLVFADVFAKHLKNMGMSILYCGNFIETLGTIAFS